MSNKTKQDKEDHEFTDDINCNINTSGNNTEFNDVLTVKTDMLVEYPYELTSTGQIQCVVCKCQVPSGIRQRKEHVNGLRHRRKVLAQNQQKEHIEKGGTKEEIEESCDANATLEEYSEHEEFVDFITDNRSTEISRSNDTAVTMKPSDFKVNTQIADSYKIKDTGNVWCDVCNFRNRIKRETRHEKKEENAVEGCDSFEEYSEDEEFYNNGNNSMSSNRNMEEGETVGEDCETNDSLGEYSEDEEFYNNENNSMSSNITEASYGNTTANSLIEYPLEVTATGHVRCVVCESKVPNHENNRNEHINGWRHRHMMNRATEQMEEDKTVEENCEEYTEECEDEELEDETVAEDCETNDSFEEYSEECADEEFYNNENDGIISNITEANYGNTIANAHIEYPLEVTATGHVRCVVCERKVPNHEKNINEHINGWRHRHLMNRATEQIEEDKTVEEDCEEYTEECKDEELEDEMVAEDCETNDSFEEYSEECEDEEFYNNENGGINNSITEANGNTIANTENEYPFEVTATGHIRCVLCECKVPNYENNRNEHINGWRHRHMVMKMNRQEESIEEEGKKEEEEEGGDNVANIELDDSFEEYSDEEEITDDNTGNNNISDGYITVNSQIEYPYQVTVTGHVRCVICDCQVPSGVQNREEHINGMRHRSADLNMSQANEYVEEQINDDFEEYSEDEEFTDDNNTL